MTDLQASDTIIKLNAALQKINDGLEGIMAYYALLEYALHLIEFEKIDAVIIFDKDCNLGIIDDKKLDNLFEAVRLIDKGVCLLRQVNAEHILQC